MEHVKVQGLTLSYPECFHILDEAERAKLRFAEEGEGVCLSAPEQHILISVAWTPVGPMLPRLLGTRELAERAQNAVRKPMSLMDYRSGGLLSRAVGGMSAEGFCYTYTAQDVPMYGETLVVKAPRAFYYLHFYARQELKAESLPVWTDFLAAAGWDAPEDSGGGGLGRFLRRR